MAYCAIISLLKLIIEGYANDTNRKKKTCNIEYVPQIMNDAKVESYRELKDLRDKMEKR